jgi:phage tail sheath protein FI
MPLLSPGVLVKEVDFSTIVPTVATAIGGIAGEFTKGPIDTPILISSETKLAEVFGTPTNTNYGVWFTAAQFLNYANKLWVVRAPETGCKNATDGTASLVKNYEDFVAKFDAGTLSTAGVFIAKDPGLSGNGLKVVLVDKGNYSLVAADAAMVDWTGKKYTAFMAGEPGTSEYVQSKAKATPTTKYDEISALVIDTTGAISGHANTVIEVFNYLSKAGDAIDYRSSSQYIFDVINTQSKYVYFNKTPTTSIDTADNTAIFAWGKESYDVADSSDKFQQLTAVVSYTMSGGVAGTTPAVADIKDAYGEFANVEEIDVNLLMTGNHDEEVMKYVIELAATRKDAVAFISPHNGSGTQLTTRSTMTTDIIAFKNTVGVADMYQSYGVMDTGFKYIYDDYNRRYRWIPLNGDIAGVTARTDDIADPWWSPAGYNRGGLKNVIKLSFNPNQSERDILYPKGINPIVTFPGSGTMMFGDRTMQEKPSAFDRINVRRLFIVLEKSIAIAAKYQLFEFNDQFTRAQFKNMVEPFLRDIQGRRGITDFMVLCDETNNTGEVIDRNEFRAEIFIQPSRSINFITLTFVATKTGIDFSTVVGGI